MLYDLTASVVAYKNSAESIRTVIKSALGTRHTIKLFLIDNSPTNSLRTELEKELADKRIVYLHTPQNLGFGKAHNIAIRSAVFSSVYHVVLNPDLEFSPAVIDDLFAFMEANPNVGQVLPKVCYQDGSLLPCKLLPTPVDLFCRRFLGRFRWASNLNKRYEVDGFDYNTCLNLPNLSGCFMFFRSRCLAEAGGFDERFFMYLEDVDLTRRMHRIAQTVYYPYVSVVHEHQRGSYNSKKLLVYHISSAMKYFSKWGWLVDRERDLYNSKVVKSLQVGEFANFNIKPEILQDQPVQTGPFLIPV